MEDIIKKFKFKDKGVILNAPTTVEEEFVKLGFKTTFDKKTFLLLDVSALVHCGFTPIS